MVAQASRISASVSMLRHTCARSGRWRRCSAVALRTTPSSPPQPSDSAAATASSAVPTRDPVPQVDAVGRQQRVQLLERQVAAGLVGGQDPRHQLPGRHRVHGRPARPARRAAWPATRRTPRPARARGRPPPRRGYDGTDPRPAVLPATSGTRSSSGMPSEARNVETSGLSDCSPTTASTSATSSPVVFSGGMKTATHRVDLVVVDRRVEGLLEVLGGRVGAEGDQLGHPQPDRDGGVGGEQAERVGVAHDRDPVAARQRLVGQRAGRRRTSRRGCRPGSPRPAGTSRRRRPAAARSSGPRGPSARPGWSGRTSPRSPACAGRPGGRCG